MKISSMVRQPIVVYTIHHRITGDLGVPEYGRVSDRLNQGRDFLPITNASVFTLTGEPLYVLDVVLVNKGHVVMVVDASGVPANGVVEE